MKPFVFGVAFSPIFNERKLVKMTRTHSHPIQLNFNCQWRWHVFLSCFYVDISATSGFSIVKFYQNSYLWMSHQDYCLKKNHVVTECSSDWSDKLGQSSCWNKTPARKFLFKLRFQLYIIGSEKKKSYNQSLEQKQKSSESRTVVVRALSSKIFGLF